MMSKGTGAIQKHLYSMGSMLLIMIMGLLFFLVGAINAATTPTASPTPTSRPSPTPTPGVTYQLDIRLSGLSAYYSCGVKADPPGTTFNQNRILTYSAGIVVTLTGVDYPQDPERFSYWSGDIGDNSPTQKTITLIMDGNKIVTANFKIGTPPRRPSPSPTPTPTPRPSPTITPTPTPITVLTYTPTPTRSITPTPRAPMNLTVNISNSMGPMSHGTVKIDPPGITISTNTTITRPFNQPVTLTAVNYVGNALFSRWSGDIGDQSPTANPITVRMDQNRTITASFRFFSPTQTPTRRPTPRITITPTPTPTPVRVTSPTPSCNCGGYIVTYTIQSDWGTGAMVNVKIINNSATAINGWTLAWTFPGNQTITTLWNGTYTQSGASVVVKDGGFNANIPANGGSVDFGFNLNYSGTNAKPANFTLNGIACQVQ